jgi:hypothetical protein
MRGLQAGVYRTSDRTIELFTHYNVLNQTAEGPPFGLNVSVTVDGTDNFSNDHTPAVALVLSRELGSHGAVYVEPTWVGNANIDPFAVDDDDDTFMVGVGARLRVRPTVYVVAEVIPRVGYNPGANHATFGIEKRAGGHMFQLNFSNGVGGTMGQLARGGTSWDDWYIGFNISRKFF